MDIRYINYLNYGKSLGILPSLVLEKNISSKEDLIKSLSKKDQDKYLIEIIESYRGRKSKKISVDLLRDDIEKTLEMKKVFSSLGCRGFSYALHESINIDCPHLSNEVNLRIALMPDDKLFYPPRIRRCLRRFNNNHYKFNGYPSICFALCKIKDDICTINIMQSDFVHRNTSFIRDHFRGWRNILMKNIVEIVKDRCKTIFLPSAHDVMACCHPIFSKSDMTPRIWLEIYDRTANDFNFSFVNIEKPTDIQIYNNLEPKMVRNLYMLNLAE